jgi:demethylmenaquinone methyltransferase/2-methoxy-6-polyprenyl-1,4-benzoquinol methylase
MSVSLPPVSPDPLVHAPHAPLTRYYGEAANRPAWVQRMFDGTAADYDRTERMIGFGSGSWYRHRALLRAGLAAGMQVLDVGTGTGLVAARAAQVVGDPALVSGLDPSPGMMQNARLPVGIRLTQGIAEAIPFPDASFDFLSMGYALRHIGDLEAAFREFYRVLRPGGRLCILEITRPRGRLLGWMLKGYLGRLVPAVARLTSREADTPRMWSYYWDTIEHCVPASHVIRMLEQCGFAGVGRHVELGVFSEYRAHRAAA